MYKVILITAMVLCQFNGTAIAQEKKGLRTGDVFPSLSVKVFNSNGAVQSLKIGPGKVLLIDFWATWCTSCTKKFSMLESIQAKYKNELTILLVNSSSTRDNETKIKKFYDRWKIKNNQSLTLPTVFDDKQLDSLFPHFLLPHYIWVGGDGIIKSITSSEHVTEENIAALLKGNQLNLPFKSDQDTRGPLFANSDLPLEKLMQYAVFIKGKQDGLPGGSRGITIGGKIRGWSYTNLQLGRIFQFIAARVYPGKGFDKNKYLFVYDSIYKSDAFADKKIKSQYIYSFQLIVPENKTDSLWHFMLKDLNRYSDYFGKIELRMDTVMTLVNIGSPDASYSRSNVPNKKTKRGGIAFTPSGLITWLSLQPWIKVPVINESGTDLSMSVVIDTSASDLHTVNVCLKSYGLELVPKITSAEYFVVSEKEHAGVAKDPSKDKF